MLCPKCNSNNKSDATWCVYCGANLKEINSNRRIHTNRAYSNDNYTRIKSDTQVFKSGEINSSSFTANPEEGLNPYSEYYAQQDSKDNKTKIIASICICASAFVIIAGLFIYKFVFSNNPAKPKDPPPEKIQISQTDEKIKELTGEAEECMDAGDYEEAETLYNELRRISKDEKTNLIYEILYNYNRAAAEYENENTDKACEFLENIPLEYTDYSISSDIDDLNDDIKATANAEKKLEKIDEYLKNEDYDAARKAIDEIDERHLLSAGKETLEELTKYLESVEEKNSKSYDYPQSGKGYLEFEDAEDIVFNYCLNMVNAINSGNYNIVSPYILSTSEFAEEQNNLIKMYVSQGITENFDSLKLNSLTKINDTVWKADVIEKETIFYADGTSVSKTFNWKYTIEYHNRRFYITDIE